MRVQILKCNAAYGDYDSNKLGQKGTQVSPYESLIKKLLFYLKNNLTLLCSATSQDSNAENKREVAIPPKTRPNIKTLY